MDDNWENFSPSVSRRSGLRWLRSTTAFVLLLDTFVWFASSQQQQAERDEVRPSLWRMNAAYSQRHRIERIEDFFFLRKRERERN